MTLRLLIFSICLLFRFTQFARKYRMSHVTPSEHRTAIQSWIISFEFISRDSRWTFYIELISLQSLSRWVISNLIQFRAISRRCKIPGCDVSNESSNYDQTWLADAIPFKHGHPVKCLRYKSTFNASDATNELSCPSVTFDRLQVLRCDEFIFKTNEHRLLKEVNAFDWQIFPLHARQ